MSEIAELLERFRRGAELVAVAATGAAGAELDWAPGPDKWSVRQILCHLADSELHGANRFRGIIAEDNPTIVAYDQDAWARDFDYHGLDANLALSVLEAARRWTVPVLERLGEEQWRREGTHTERGRYTVEDWLRGFAEHLVTHARQIERNTAAWKARPSGETAKGSILA